MNKESWKKIKAIFNAVLELPLAEQEAYLAEQTKNEPELFLKIKEMLNANDSIESKITKVVSSNIEQLYSENFSLNKGDLIGVYEIQRLIGKGGLGAVFEAHRVEDGFQQTVAIKIIQAQNLNQESINRFQSERQILANLNHPNIAHLIDGGTTDKNLPYLVMEYVEGLPIVDYCKENGLSIKQRIQLFLQVCNAVSYAHQNLIVHRDIKPGNILVNNEGQVKLLDFGIAKILEPESFSHDIVETRIETRLLSLENASPEQILGKNITTQTDVYTLGNLLYQLLTEETLFQIEKNARLQLERAICETQPVKPSTAITYQNSIVEANKVSSLKHIQNYLKGDLDTITLKALQKEPENRYRSVENLAGDINRYLNNFPIHARPEKLSYKIYKFFIRNKLTTAFASLFLVSIIGFSIVLSIKTVQLQQEKDRAIQEANNATLTTNFLVSLFENASPKEKGSPFATSLDLLNEGMKRINDELPEDTQSKAEMLHSLGMSYLPLDEYEKSILALKEALRIFQKTAGSHTLKAANTMHRLGDALRQSGANEEGYEYLKEALSIRESLIEENTYEIADSYNNLAQVVRSLGRLEEAIKLQNKSISLHELRTVTESLHIPYYNLSLMYKEKKDYLKAYELALISISKYYTRGNQSDSSTLSLMHINKGRMEYYMGFFEDSAKSIEESIVQGLKVYPKTHQRILVAYRVQAQLKHRAGLYKKADDLFAENMKNCIQFCSKFRPNFIAYINKNWALLKQDMKEFKEAKRLIALAVQQFIDFRGEHNYATITHKLIQADIVLSSGDFEYFNQLITNLKNLFANKEPPLYSKNYLKLIEASYFSRINKPKKALFLLTGLDAYFKKSSGENGIDYAKFKKISDEIHQLKN